MLIQAKILRLLTYANSGQWLEKHANGRSELMAADVHQESDALHQNDKHVEHCMAAMFDDCRRKRTSDKLNAQRACPTRIVKRKLFENPYGCCVKMHQNDHIALCTNDLDWLKTIVAAVSWLTTKTTSEQWTHIKIDQKHSPFRLESRGKACVSGASLSQGNICDHKICTKSSTTTPCPPAHWSQQSC